MPPLLLRDVDQTPNLQTGDSFWILACSGAWMGAISITDNGLRAKTYKGASLVLGCAVGVFATLPTDLLPLLDSRSFATLKHALLLPMTLALSASVAASPVVRGASIPRRKRSSLTRRRRIVQGQNDFKNTEDIESFHEVYDGILLTLTVDL
jgi:hypothetical protein